MTDTAKSSDRRLRAVLLGAGSLGRAFLRALRESQAPVELVSVITAHHGRLMDESGIDASLAVNLVESEGLGESAPADVKKVLESTRPDVLIEAIPQNIRSGDPALGYLRTALDMGIHVVTANKAAIVLGYRDLLHRAAKTNTQFRFEATVLDGVPLFSMLAGWHGVDVTSVRGVLNGTSSLVLESVQLGSTRSRGLARAQALGIAEADSVLDLDGWDAAAKAALIANVVLGGSLRVFDVTRTGCESIKDDLLRETAEACHYRLVANISKGEDGGVRATVAPEAIEPGDPYYALRGASGAVTVRTDAGIELTAISESPGLESAAAGMVQDCWAILNGGKQP